MNSRDLNTSTWLTFRRISPRDGPSPLPTTHRPGSGFTLIELLVVIAVIAILSSLLMPALRGARQKAQATKCLSTLWQFGVGAAAYTANHGGEYLPTWRKVNGNQRPWCGDPDLREAIGVAYNAQWFRLPASQICPGATLSWEGGKTAEGYLVDRSYGYNKEDMQETYGDSGQAEVWGFRTGMVSFPASTLMMADATDWMLSMNASAEYLTAGEAYPPLHMIAYRHRGRANILFYDGHAEARDDADVTNNTKLWKAIR